MPGRFEYQTRRFVDDRARARIDRLKHRLDLFARLLGVDLDEIEAADAVDRRAGNPASWTEMLAVGLDPDTGRPAA
jgi:hypothetical protein